MGVATGLQPLSPIMLTYLRNGPLKLAIVLFASWLSLFTLFITFSTFLRGPEFRHPVSTIPDGVVEQRVFSVAALKSYPLSPANKQMLSSLSAPYIPFTFDTTPLKGMGPIINRETPARTYSYHLNGSFSIPISSKHNTPWSTFGVQPTDAALLNEMVYDAGKGTWMMPRLVIYAWLIKSETTPEHEVIQLSLKQTYTPGDEFASLVRTNDAWSIHFMHNSHASAPSRALPFLRASALFLWPVLFHNFLGVGGLTGVILLWICAITTGYATITILVTHWLINQNTGEITMRQGAALRWEEEGWEDMGVVVADQDVHSEDGETAKLDA